jgi:hypothetical protein
MKNGRIDFSLWNIYIYMFLADDRTIDRIDYDEEYTKEYRIVLIAMKMRRLRLRRRRRTTRRKMRIRIIIRG